MISTHLRKRPLFLPALLSFWMSIPSLSWAEEENPIFKALQDAGRQIKEGVASNLPTSETGGKPLGYVRLKGNQFLTYFPNIDAGYLSNDRPLGNISEASRSSIPVIGVTPDGIAFPNIQSKLQASGVTMQTTSQRNESPAESRQCKTNAEGVGYTPDGRMVLNYDANCNGTNVMSNGTVNCKLNVDGTPVGKYDKSDNPRIGSVVKQEARAAHCIEVQRAQAKREILEEEAAAAKKK